MTNRVVLALFASIVAGLLSCSHDLQKNPPIKRIINEFGKGNRFDAVLLIPVTGCPGCISGAEMFAKRNLDNCKILFLFTRINSEKTLRSKLGLDALPENLIFDRKNRFAIAPDLPESEYPLVIYFNRDSKSSLDVISHDNYEAYEKLINFVDNKVRFYDLARAVDSDVSATSLSTLCNDVRYVALGKENDALISTIMTCWTDSGEIFISDTEGKIFAFNDDGISLGRIGSKGEGPEEYRTLVGGKFILDKKRKEVIIPDMGGKKLVFYDYRGAFLRSVILNYLPDDLAILADSLLLIQTQPFQDLQGQICNIVILDRSGTEVATIPAGHIPSLNFISSAKLDVTNGDVYFEEPLNDTIYRFRADFSKCPAAVIRMGKYKPPAEIFGDISRWPEYSADYIFNRYIFHEDRDLWFSLYKDVTLYSGYFRYTDGMPVLLFRGRRGEGINDDIDSGPPFNPFFKAGDEFLVDFIEPTDLLDEKYESIRDGSPLKEIRTHLTVNDNPVVRILMRH